VAVLEKTGEDAVAGAATRGRPSAFKWIILLPAVAILTVTAVLPALWLFYTSFFQYEMMTGIYRFIGVGNYIDFLADAETWGYMGNTLLYVVGSVGIGFPIAVGLAKLLSLNIRFRTLWLVAIILPWVAPKIAGAIMWNWMIHEQYGVLNYILKNLGLIDQYIAFLAQSWSAMMMLIIVDMWYWTPFAALILFGGFTRVPNELVEAAQLDGATTRQIFFKIELPYIVPEILAALMLRTMFTFREFGIPFLMGQGGPGRTTEVLGLTIYRHSISWLQIGAGATLSVILLIIMVMIVTFYFRVIRVNEGLKEEQVYE